MTDEPTVGAIEHVDATFLTILRQNEVNGLLTKTRNGEWLQVTFPGKSTFVVLTGLSFKVPYLNYHFSHHALEGFCWNILLSIHGKFYVVRLGFDFW